MADAPKLNSATDATAAKYAPLSALAVLSLAVAGVYLLLLAYLGYLAYQAKQPLLQSWLFAVPAVGMFLAFLARRQIRTSEGARTGEGYANTAWWICLVTGACYLAYLIANDLAVRADSERALTQWADKLATAKPTDPTDKPTWEAFERTLDPGEPLVGNPQLATSPQVAVRYGVFRNTALLVVWDRNRTFGAKFTPTGLRNWDLSPDGKLSCEAAAILSCPEGDFPVVVPMLRVSEPKKESRWQVSTATAYKFLEAENATRTKYGWLVLGLERSAMAAADRYVQLLHTEDPYGPFGPSVAMDRYVAGHLSAEHTDRLTDPTGLAARLVLVGPSAMIVGPTDPTQAKADFFTRPNGQPHTDAPFARPDGQKLDRGGVLASLRKVWDQPKLAVLYPAFRSRLRNPDMAPKNPIVDATDPTRVVVKVPMDFSPRREEYPGKTFTSGYLVMVCDDPAAVKEVTAAREDAVAGRDRPKADQPDTLRDFTFRVLRFETDLLPLLAPESGGGGGGPGGPGGPGG